MIEKFKIYANITTCSRYRGVAQLGLAHLLWEQGVGGSNPLTPTI